MKKDFTNNDNSGGSSIFKARIREQDIAANQKLQEIQGAADELARQAIIDKLKQAEVEYEKLKLKLEQEASGRINNILSYVELSAAENEDNFTSGIDGLLAKLFKFFNFMDSELGVETDPQVYSMIKEREKKQVWIAAVIKFLRDKFNKLIKAIFSRDLSFQQKIDQEIERLFKRLFENDLSQEEEAAVLERLEALRDLKLKLQIFAVGAIIKMFAELFSVELTASVETTKEEGKEKAPAKEATKEVRENLEIKVDAKEKPQLKYDVIPALDAGIWLKKQITLTKQEHDLLPKSLKDMLPPVPKDDMNKGNSGVPKPEVKERQGNENKKPTQPAQEPKKATPPLAPKQPAQSFFESEDSDKDDRRGNAINRRKILTPNKQKGGVPTTRSANTAESTNVPKPTNTTQSANEQKMDDLCNELAGIMAQAKSQSNFPPIDHWQEQVRSDITDVGVDNVKDQSVGRNDERTGMSRG